MVAWRTSLSIKEFLRRDETDSFFNLKIIIIIFRVWGLNTVPF